MGLDIKDYLKRYNIKPNKLMGQNFLMPGKIADDIINALSIRGNDCVVEVGPGLGQLTFKLADKAGKVVAVEKDKNLSKILREIIKNSGVENIEVIEGDILKFNFESKNLKPSYKLVGNIPYYLTSFLIRKLLELELGPSVIVLMVQKEVAQRICAKPPKMSILSCAVQFYGKPEIIDYISKNNFYPKPRVDSAVLKIIPSVRHLKVDNINFFFKIVKLGFRQPRKQILNNLKALPGGRDYWQKILDSCKIKCNLRPGELSLDDWVGIYEAARQ